MNIIIINSSSPSILPFHGLFEELSAQSYSFRLYSNNRDILEEFKTKNWPAKYIMKPPKLTRWRNFLPYLFLSPLLLLFTFFFLLIQKTKYKINTLICCNWFEKIFFTPCAKILGLKTVWLEYPGLNYNSANKLSKWLFRVSSKKVSIIALTSHTIKQLKEIGIKNENIYILTPGIKLSRERQENLFDNLARSKNKTKKQNFFTIGTVAELDKRQQVEALFRAVQNCLNVIPNIQIVIVGDGPERKNLTWLAKKMKIDNLVWFVGQQKQTGKWLDGFDLYTSSSNNLSLNDINATLKAMKSGLPIIGQERIGLEDFVNEDNGLLINMNDTETLTQGIIVMSQNKELRLKLGQNSRKQVEALFSLESMVHKFKSIFA